MITLGEQHTKETSPTPSTSDFFPQKSCSIRGCMSKLKQRLQEKEIKLKEEINSSHNHMVPLLEMRRKWRIAWFDMSKRKSRVHGRRTQWWGCPEGQAYQSPLITCHLQLGCHDPCRP